MRSLFLKIFGVLWIAQSLIAVISTAIILRQRAPDGGASVRTLRDGLNVEAVAAATAYQEHGCEALQQLSFSRRHEISIVSPEHINVCSRSPVSAEVNEADIGDNVFGHSEGDHYLWRVPVNARQEAYDVLIAVPRSTKGSSLFYDIRDFGFPQLPIMLAVGGATTFLLVLFLTRPLALLGEKARAMASGDLSARVPQSRSMTWSGEDAFQELNRDFNMMADRLQSVVEAHKLLLRDVSHELRSPLTRINVALGLARNRSPQAASLYLDRVEQEADRLNEMIKQLLTLSALDVETGKAHEQFSLIDLIEELLPDAQFEASLAGSSVRLEPGADFEVCGDRNLLFQALENVIRNAVHYTEPQSEVLVRVNESGLATPAVLIQILDHGPGIPPQDLEAIFRPFYRTDTARSFTTEGFGVGLAIAERSVQKHRGTIKAKNRKEGGTEIRIVLPAASRHD